MYGFWGLFGIIISSTIIGFLIYLVLSIVKKNNIKKYSEFVSFLVGKNRIVNYTINNIINIFLLFSFIIMVSGFGAFFKQEFNIPVIYGSIIICLLALITFYKSIGGIIKINSFLIPCLICLILLLGLKTNLYSFNRESLIIYSNNNWLFTAILYASYNLIILIPILINIGSFVNNKKSINIIAIFTLVSMCIMSIIIYMVLCINFNQIKYVDIPILFIAGNMRKNI